MSAETARAEFEELVAWAMSGLVGEEVLLARLSGEDSDFTRFNHATLRQAGSVRQRRLSVDVIDGSRHADGSISLTGDADDDRARLGALLRDLRDIRAASPADPHLLFSTDVTHSERRVAGSLPAPGEVLDAVVSGAAGADLVGVYGAGESFKGFASSLGQRNWFSSSTFNLDWSLHLRADKATKSMYAGSVWDEAVLGAKLRQSVSELEVLDRQPVRLDPGVYRAFLAPAAMEEIISMLAWDGFGLRAHRTRRTPLLRMVTEGAELDRRVRIAEDIGGGTAPDFQSDGFRRPDEVVLIDEGRYAGHLVSPRSAKEFGETPNGAEDWELPVSLAMAPGDLPSADVIPALGTGLYVGNLWYLNFSDRAGCRTTGMTRFGTFWAEGGEIVAPVEVLRFDDTAYNLLGDRLEGLTDEAETILDASTYGGRSTESIRLPGALVEEMVFTL